MLGLVAQVAPQVGLERPPRGLAAGTRRARGRPRPAPLERLERGRQRRGGQAGRAGARLQAAQRRLEHRVGARAALHRLGVGADAARGEQALDEPAHPAGGERLELPRALRAASGELLEHRRGHGRGQRRRVGLRARRGLGAAQLARRRRLARRPRHLGEQPPPALRPQLVGEQRAHVVEERRGDQRLALLVGRAPGQEQHLLRARDAGVEQRALAVEHVLVQRQPQPRGGGEPAPRVVVEERLGHRPLRELRVLQPAHEDGAEAPRADLERVGEQHALGRVALAHLDRRQRLEHVLGTAEQRRIARREPAQLARRRPQLGGHARLVALVGVEQVGAAHVRGRPDRVGLGDERGEQRLRPLGRGVRRARRGARARPAPSATPPRGRPRSRCAAHGRRARPPRPARRACRASAATPAGRAAVPPGRAARTPASSPEPSRVRPSGTRRAYPTGIPYAPRTCANRAAPASPAHEHRDLLRRDAVAHQLEHLGADDLRLGALAARLQQPHGAVGRPLLALRPRTGRARGDGAPAARRRRSGRRARAARSPPRAARAPAPSRRCRRARGARARRAARRRPRPPRAARACRPRRAAPGSARRSRRGTRAGGPSAPGRPAARRAPPTPRPRDRGARAPPGAGGRPSTAPRARRRTAHRPSRAARA